MNVAKKLTLPEELLIKTDNIVKEEGFLNFQDFALTALRKYIKEKENQENIKFLKSLQGKSKGKYLTKKDRMSMKEMSKKEQSEIFREFGLD